MQRNLCIAGKNRIAVESAEYVQANYPELQLSVVVNSTDSGHDTWQPSLLYWAECNSVPVRTLEDLYLDETLCFISLEYNRLLNPALFKTKDLFNIHFSLLPEYKGMYTSSWPILEGKDYSGVTLHRIDTGIDTGDIIDQTRFQLDSNDTARDLYEHYLDEGILLLRARIKDLLNGSFDTYPQPASGSTYRARQSLDFKQLPLDLKQTASCLRNQIRAFIFPEYQLPVLYSNPISGAEILSTRSRGEPGTIVAEDAFSLTLATIDYDIRLLKVDK